MKEYKPIILVLSKFFIIYLLSIGLYYLYLTYYQDKLSTCDPFTELVANQASQFLHWFGIDSQVYHYPGENIMRFFINKKMTSYVNEGCNALSVMILYLSFIIAFASTFKKTFLYLVITLIILHLANIIRVAVINYVFAFYPEYGKDFHDYFFPSIIYGLTIFLWMGWIKFFVFKKK